MQQRTTSEWARSLSTEGPGRRHRVLVEDPHAAWFADFTLFRSHGFEVAVCTGPDRCDAECALLDDRECRFAEDTDVVFFGLDAHESCTPRILELMRERHPETPIVIRLPAGCSYDPALVEGCDTIADTASLAEQFRVLRRAIARHDHRSDASAH